MELHKLVPRSAIVQKMNFSIKYFLDLVTFTEEILNGKVHFLCSVHLEPSQTCIVVNG